MNSAIPRTRPTFKFTTAMKAGTRVALSVDTVAAAGDDVKGIGTIANDTVVGVGPQVVSVILWNEAGTRLMISDGTGTFAAGDEFDWGPSGRIKDAATPATDRKGKVLKAVAATAGLPVECIVD